jgi:hypothetical protein
MNGIAFVMMMIVSAAALALLYQTSLDLRDERAERDAFRQRMILAAYYQSRLPPRVYEYERRRPWRYRRHDDDHHHITD